ncbi:MAG: hypothetical protein GY795_51375, partial [Desulfobacterales bacterium]|nr:hypothetical protein [Desulfobacterales bacterium]
VPMLRRILIATENQPLQILPDKKNVRSITDMESPNSKKGADQFIGAVGFLRDHIPGLTELLTPLRKAIAAMPFKWDSDCERCFLKVKELITTPNALVCFDPQCETIVTTDASDVGMGGAISQIINGQEKIIAYWSKTFTKMEQNYPVVDRECLAIVAMIEKFKHLLLGRHFTVWTDQISLKSICLNLTSVKGTQRCKRWMLRLEFYSFTVE